MYVEQLRRLMRLLARGMHAIWAGGERCCVDRKALLAAIRAQPIIDHKSGWMASRRTALANGVDLRYLAGLYWGMTSCEIAWCVQNGYELSHLCGNGTCCVFEHLMLETSSINHARRKCHRRGQCSAQEFHPATLIECINKYGHGTAQYLQANAKVRSYAPEIRRAVWSTKFTDAVQYTEET